MKKYLFCLIVSTIIFSCNHENDDLNVEKTDSILFQFSEYATNYSVHKYDLKSTLKLSQLLVDNETIKGMRFYNSIALNKKEILPVSENEGIVPTELEKRILVESLNSYLEDRIF